MSLPVVHPLAIDSFAVLLSAGFIDSFSTDEQAIIGAFFNVLGDLITLNSAYVSYLQPPVEDNQESTFDDKKDEFELLKKSIDKLQEEIKKCSSVV